MDPFFEKKLISTKDAGELSGYTSDYLARLARAGKIVGKRVGHSWFIDSESLTAFLGEQESRKLDYTRALARAREAEYRAHHSLLNKATKALQKPLPVPPLSSIQSWLGSPIAAMVIAVLVVGAGAYTAQVGAEPLALSVARVAVIASEISFGFAETFGDIPSRIASRVQETIRAMDAVAPRVREQAARSLAHITPAFLAPLETPTDGRPELGESLSLTGLAEPNLSFMRLELDEGVERYVALAPKRASPAFAQTFTMPDAHTLAQGAYALLMNPSRVVDIATNTFSTMGDSVYVAIDGSLRAYDTLITQSGARAFTLAVRARDTLAQHQILFGAGLAKSPYFVARMNLALGESVIAAAHLAIQLDVAAAYGTAAVAPESARVVVALIGNTGDVLASVTTRVAVETPTRFKLALRSFSAAGPALAEVIFGAEYAVAQPFIAFVNGVSGRYLALIEGAGSTGYTVTDGGLALVRTLPPLFAGVPPALEDAYLGALGKGALALRSFSEVGLTSLQSRLISASHFPPVAAVLVAAAPTLSLGERVALTTYVTIRDLFAATNRVLATLFGPPPSIVLPRSALFVRAPTTNTTTSYPTYTTVVQGVSKDFVNQSLATLRADILGAAAGMIQPVFVRSFSESRSAGGSVTSVNISGGTTGLTASGGPITIDGTLTLSGTLNAVNGGTGSSTPLGGILVGNGTSAINSLAVGSGLAFDGTTLTSTGVTGVSALTKGNFLVGDDAGVAQATSSIFISSLGNVGIGTTSPAQALSVQGNGLFSGNLSVAGLTATGTATIGSLSGLIAGNSGTLYQVASSSLFGFTPISNALAKGNFIVGNDAGVAQATSSIFISSTGSVGIGTTTPYASLSVAGAAGGTAPLFVVSTSTATFATSTAFTINSNGNVLLGNGNATAPALSFLSDSNTGFFWNGNTDQLSLANGGTEKFRFSTTHLSTASGVGLALGSFNTASQAVLQNGGNGIFSQVNGTQAQEYRIYNTDSTDDEFVSLGFLNNSNVFTIETEETGAGTVRNIALLGGSVGIGTTSPAQALSVHGNGLFSGNLSVAGLTATGTVSFATALPVSSGGTGVSTFGGTNTLLYTTAADTLSSIANTTNGFVLALSGGVPTWVATSSVNNGVSSIGPTGQALTGAVLIATSSTAFNGLTASTTVTGSGQTLTFTNTLAGLLGVGGGGTGLSSLADGSLVFGSGGTTALTALATTSGAGGFLSQSYTTGRPAWTATTSLGINISDTTGTLAVAKGGTGVGTFTSGQLLYGNGTANLSSVATSSLTATGLLSISNAPSIIGSSGAVVTLPLTKGNFIVGDDAGVAQATSSIFISSTGSVGIGTTSPATLLSVAGNGYLTGGLGVGLVNAVAGTFQTSGAATIGGALTVNGLCVTGDTKLKRRRRRRRADGSLEDYFDDVRIDEIKAGDEILTLDQKTGGLVASRVKQLAYMGKKQTYKLTTASGKTIRTTANHPYLVRPKPLAKGDLARATGAASLPAHGKATSIARGLSRIGVFIDSSNFYHAAKKADWTVDISKLKLLFAQAGSLMHMHYHVAVPEQHDATYKNAKKYLDTIGAWVTLYTKPLKYLIDDKGRLTKKGDVDVELALDVVENLAGIDIAVVMSGDSDYRALDAYARKQGVPIVFMGYKANMAWELRLANHLFVEHIRSWIERGNENPDLSAGAELVKSIIDKAISLSSVSSAGGDNSPSLKAGEGSWLKVAQLKEGMEVAIAGDTGTGEDARAVWDRIISVEPVALEDVYDIEVEGTHNFIGNGIVAHNTAFFNQASTTMFTNSGNTYLTGLSASSLIATDANKMLISTTSIGVSNLALAKGNFLVGDDAGVAQATSSIFISSLGNVGIGTTSPATTLSVQGNGLFSGNLSAANLTATGTVSFATALPVSSGGTGQSTFTSSQLLYGNGTDALTSVATTTLAFSGPFSGASSLGALVGGSASTVTWTGLATTSQPASSNLLVSNGGAGVYGVGTTSASCASGIACTSFDVLKNGGAITLATINAGVLGAQVNGSVPTSQATSTLYGTGTGGQVLGWSNAAGGLAFIATSSSLGSLGSGFATTTGSSITFSTTTLAFNGLTFGQTIVPSAGALLFTPTVTGTLSVGGGGTGQSTFTSSQLLYGNGTDALSSVATTTATLGSEFSYSGTLGALVGGANGSLTLATNGTALTKLAQIAANTILGNNTGATGNVVAFATSSLGLAISDTTGTLAVARGGTGQTAFGQGWLHSDGFTITSSTSPTVNYLTATSTTATSTFAGGLALETSGFVYDFSSNNVGIGTAAPASLLHLNKSNVGGTTFLTIQNTSGQTNDTANIDFRMTTVAISTGRVAAIRTGAGALTDLAFSTFDASNLLERMRITSSGNIGIGTTTPNWLLQVAGTRPSFALSDTAAGANLKHWLFSSQGGNFYIATSSDAYATSTLAALTINSSGIPIFNSLGGSTGCAQFDSTGTLSNTGTACGSGGGITALGSGFASTTGTTITFSTTTLAFNGLTFGQTIVPSANALMFTPTVSGTLSVGGGGTGNSTLTSSQLLYGNGTDALSSVATSSLTATGLLSISNSPSIIGASGAVVTLPLAKGNFIVGDDAGVAQATSTIFISSLGSVGIGTTSPATLLSVAGNGYLTGGLGVGLVNAVAGTFQTSGAATIGGALTVNGLCVTGDTKLKRRRRRRRADGSLEDYFDDVRIDEIKAGDEILTLDQKTGRLVPARVKQLAYMGTKTIFEIETANGKKIRTTANHPYLALRSSRYASRATIAPVSSSIRSPLKSFAREYSMRSASILARCVRNVAGNTRNTTRPGVFARENFAVSRKSVSLVSSMRDSLSALAYTFSSVSPTGERTASWPSAVSSRINRVLKFSSHKNFTVRRGDTRNALSLGAARGEFEPGANVFAGDGRPVFENLVDGLSVSERFEHLPHHDAGAGECQLTSTDLRVGDDVSVDREFIHADDDSSLRAMMSNARWTRVANLFVGDAIAALRGAGGGAQEGDKVVFTKIARITILPAEDVYDIEVEGTHNFIGNGIVAHNTAFFNQASTTMFTNSGNTYLTGLSASSLIATDANKMLISTTSIGVSNLALAKGNFIVGDDAGVAQATSTIFISSLGSVGIGTTSPYSLLTLYKAGATAAASPQLVFSASSTVSGNTLAMTNWAIGTDLADFGKFKISSSSVIGTNDRLVIDGAGNVGIGTSSPQARLEIVNTSAGAAIDQLYLSNLSSATSSAARLSFRTGDVTNATTTATIRGVLNQNFDRAEGDLIFSTMASGTTRDVLTLTGRGTALFGSSGITADPVGPAGDPTNYTFISTVRSLAPSTNGQATSFTGVNASFVIQGSAANQASPTLIGVQASPDYSTGTGNPTNITGFLTRPSLQASITGGGTVTTMRGVTVGGVLIGAGSGSNAVVTTRQAFYAEAPTLTATAGGTVTITNNYGLFVDPMTQGTNNWNIFSDGATTRNYFGGKVGIGTTTPNWLLQIASSTGTASGAMLAISDTGAGANLKHWTLSSQGGNFYIATSSDALATSTVSALSINSTSGAVAFGNNLATCVALTGAAGLCDGDDATGAGGAFAWTPTTYNGVAVNSTSTALWLKATSPFSLIASSTFATYASSTNLTTTGDTWLATTAGAKVGVGSTSPYAKLAIAGATNDNFPQLAINANIGQASTTPSLTINHSDGSPAIEFRTGGSGKLNTFIGVGVGATNTTGTNNTAVGRDALGANTTASGNSAFGSAALGANTTGADNSAFGMAALLNNTTGTFNTAMGRRAGSLITSGGGNVLLGYQAGDNLTTGSSSIIIGFDIDAPSATANNQLNIGNLIFGTALDGTGSTLSSGKIGIGTTTPWAQLSINPTAALGSAAAFAIGSSTRQMFSITPHNAVGTIFDYGTVSTTTIKNLTAYAWTIATSTTARPIFMIDTSSGTTTIGVPTGDVIIGDVGISPNLVFANSATIKGDSGGKTLTIGAGTDIVNIAVATGFGSTTPWRTLSVTGTVGFDGLTASTTIGDSLCLSNLKEVTLAVGRNCATASSLRFKQDVNSLTSTSGLVEVMKLNPVSFYYRPDFLGSFVNEPNWNGEHAGFIAEEVAAIDPRFATFDKEGRPDTVRYEFMTSILTKAVQDINKGYTLNNLGTGATSTIASFYTGTSNSAVTIDASGNVGIGAESTSGGKLAVSGNVFASSYETAQSPATSFMLDASAITAQIPSSVLTANGTVDLYKLATYNLSGVEALAAALDAQNTRITSLETRITALEDGSISSSSGTVFSTSTLAEALDSFGVLIQKGIAQFGTLVFRQLVASSDENGTSSAGSVTILAGNTVAQINNSLVHPSTKVFATFNSQLTGSWWVSDKALGSFRVVLSGPQTSDVSFDYFLVQTEGQLAASAAAEGEATSTPSVVQGNGSPSINLEAELPSESEPPPPPSSTTPDSGSQIPSVPTSEVGTPTESVGADTAPPVVSDVEPPVVTLTGDAALQITVGDTFTDPGATAFDETDGDLTAHINVSGAVDTATAGLYTLTYSATDAAGNTGSASRVVTVVASALSTSAPTLEEAGTPTENVGEVGTPTESVGAEPAPAPEPTPEPTPEPAPEPAPADSTPPDSTSSPQATP